ncbi:MAG TPA: metallophosphoesterase [Bacteroidales bacterium]|nr:metallophosphoesterase [Bacteroidales bacterium]
MMAAVIIFALIFEVLSFLAIKDHYLKPSGVISYIIAAIHFSLSAIMWVYIFKVIIYRGCPDEPSHLNDRLIFTGLLSAVLIPRSIFSTVHFTGKLIRRKKGEHIRWLTNTAIICSAAISLVFGYGSIFGRFNFRTEEVPVNIKDLNQALDGIRIAHLTDMHLSSFYNKSCRLEEAMKTADSYNPDLIVNTGDFITLGYREFDRFDTVLVKYRGKFGNFAILGNHDMGTYLPGNYQEEKRSTQERMRDLVLKSGYYVLNDENTIISIKGVKVAIIGVKTAGSHPDIIYGDLKKAVAGTDSASLKILLCHDPNQWEEDVVGKTDIELSLAGHTHGMQMGIITRNFRWSPAGRYYPRWNGLYTEGDQHLYVNRGLGVLGVPFRIWMPPEITIITLRSVK